MSGHPTWFSVVAGDLTVARRRRRMFTIRAGEGALMVDRSALDQLRCQRFFEGWDEFVSPERVQASEASVRRLIDDLLALDLEATEDAARLAVDECVRRFNTLDDGWICTIEREDIYEQIGRVVETCGFECDEDWLRERDW